MLEDIKAEDVASFITAASAAKKAGKKKFSIGGKTYPVTIGKALEQRVAEMSEDDIIELNDKKKSKYLTAMKARLNKEDTGISIARKMMQITSMRHLAEIIAEMEIITLDELQSIVSEDLKIAARSLFLENLEESEEIVETENNSTDFDFDGVMVRITRNNFDNLDEDMKNNTVNEETVSIDGVHMPVLFVAETRQMKDVKNEIMVQLKGKVKVIDKKDEKKYLAMGYTLAECMELQIEAASPEKIMKDIAALEKMLTKFGGNSSAVKMKKVALERKIAKLEKELENMDEATQEAYGNYKKKLKEYGYGPAKKKKKMKESAEDYKDHMMYDPKTGKGRMTTSYEDHLALKDKGWGHEKPTSESYGKMNASKMSSKEKAKARALSKADREAQPKDKVSLKKAPWDKKMKEDFVKQMNIIVEGGELEQSIEESMSPKQIDMLKKSYESMRGKRISVENGMKLSKTLEKLDKESAIAIAKADIPFMSNLAINKLIMNFGMSGADIKKAMKESVELDEMREPYAVVDTAAGNKVVGTASDEKGAKSIITSAELPPMKIKDKKTLKIVKVKKKQMIGYPIKESVELDESAGDMEKAAAELEAYAKKNGGMDKNTFMRVANLLKTGHPDKLKSYVNNIDTEPREYVAMLLKKHIGKKSTEKMMDIKFRGESISWEDAETLRAAGVKLDEISSDMKKRYNKAALKDRDQQKNTLKRADDVGSKVVDGAVTDKASPSQTNSRFAKLGKIKQKANRKLANRRKGLATPGKGSTTKVKDYFGMAEEISGTGYELYHKTLGSAIDTAITHAKLKFGIDITPDERMEVVGMGPRKPSNGKTNTYRLMGNKGKAIQVQVYNRGGSRPYELNMYKE